MGDLSANFSKWEFACSCGCDTEFTVSRDLLRVLEAVRAEAGESLRVTSGMRCRSKNESTPGAAKNSWHIPRKGTLYASDITYWEKSLLPHSDIKVLRLYVAADNAHAAGLGLYKGRIHVDQRPPVNHPHTRPSARWVDKGWRW